MQCFSRLKTLVICVSCFEETSIVCVSCVRRRKPPNHSLLVLVFFGSHSLVLVSDFEDLVSELVMLI